MLKKHIMLQLSILLSIASSINSLPLTANGLNSFDIARNESNICSYSMEKEENTSYDFMTYDFKGHKNYYHYDDFLFERENKSCGSSSERNFNIEKTSRQSGTSANLPYSAICTVYTCYDTDRNGYGDTTFVGSGALIGPDEILTAEENTYITEYGYPSSIFVALGEHIENGTLVKPFGIQYVTAVMRGNYHTTFNPNDNWALMRIDSSIGYTTDWLCVSDVGISNNSTVKTIGYDNTSSYQCTVYSGNVSNLHTYSFRHSALPTTMANGAPIFDSSLNTIVGIQTGQRTTINGISYSEACKVSIYIKKWIMEDCGALRITIFAQPTGQTGSSFGDWGHVWISVQNNSPSPVTIGKMDIASNYAVTLGTWQTNMHTGLLYNLEYLLTHNGNDLFPNRVSYSRNIFLSDWEDANSYVELHDSWSFPNNMCTHFALGVWNKALPDYKISCSATPNAISNKIKAFDEYEEHAPVPGSSNCGYYNNDDFVSASI